MEKTESEHQEPLADYSPEAVERLGFVAQLRKRRVIQVLLIYLAVAFGATEILLTVAETLKLPDWTQTLVVAFFVAGIPVAAFVAWAFEFTSAGIRVEVASLRGGIAITMAATMLVGLATILFVSGRTEAPPEKPGRGNVFADTVATVAVFPFDSGKDDGLLEGNAFAEEIVMRLGRHADLNVVSTMSTSAPRLLLLQTTGKATALRADYLVTGRIGNDGSIHRIEADMLSANGTTLWSDELRFSTRDASLAKVLSGLTNQIANTADATLPAAETCPPSSSLEALGLYHKARAKLNLGSVEDIEDAVLLLKKALALDAGYSRAWEALASTYVSDKNLNPSVSGPLATDAARRALDLCPSLGIAYSMRVNPREEGDNEIIREELHWLDALAIEPNVSTTISQYARHLSHNGRIRRACQLHQRNFRNHPLRPVPPDIAGQCGEFLTMRQVQAGAPSEGGVESCDNLAAIYFRALHGDNRAEIAKLISQARDANVLCDEIFLVQDPLQLYDAMQADLVARRSIIETARRNYLPTRANAAMVLGIYLADYNLAFEALEIARSRDETIHLTTWWDDSPQAQGFRSDPRFAAVVDDLGLVEYWQRFGWPDGMCSPLGDSVVCQ